MDLLSAAKEAGSILRERGVPGDILDGFPQLFDVMSKIVVTKPELMAGWEDEGNSLFQASDLFLDYLSALRARDWPQVRVIDHLIRSPNLSPNSSDWAI